MAQDCCVSDGSIMILACSGGSNVGQLANQAAVELTQEGFGKFFCLAGIGGHLSGFVQSAKDVPNLVVIDGCAVGCAKTILGHTAIALKNYFVVTDLGIEKNKDFKLKNTDVQKLKNTVQALCKEGIGQSVAENAGPATCCG
jgi:uncharacterized metal-binding protein